MPLVKHRDLATMAMCQGITWWSYKAGEHTGEDILSKGYFDDFRYNGVGGIAGGDWILVSGPGWGMQLYVTAHDPSVVVEIAGVAGVIPIAGPKVPA